MTHAIIQTSEIYKDDVPVFTYGGPLHQIGDHRVNHRYNLNIWDLYAAMCFNLALNAV